MVHDCLADPEVVVDPLLDARGLGELLGLHTGTVSGSMLAWFCCGGGGNARCCRTQKAV